MGTSNVGLDFSSFEFDAFKRAFVSSNCSSVFFSNLFSVFFSDFFGAGDFDLFRIVLAFGGLPGPRFFSTISGAVLGDGLGDFGGRPGPRFFSATSALTVIFGGLPLFFGITSGAGESARFLPEEVVLSSGKGFFLGLPGPRFFSAISGAALGDDFGGLPRFRGGEISAEDLFFGGRPLLRGGAASGSVSGSGFFLGLPGPRFTGCADGSADFEGGLAGDADFLPEALSAGDFSFGDFDFRVSTLRLALFSVSTQLGQNQPESGTDFRGGLRQKM